jgi:hypothetical protein
MRFNKNDIIIALEIIYMLLTAAASVKILLTP